MNAVRFQLEHLLDKCLSQLNEGADLEEVLAGFPAHADELRPALAASAWMREIAPPPRRRLENKAELMATVARRRREVETVEGVVVEVRAGVPLDDLLTRLPVALHPAILAAHRMETTPTPMPAAETFAQGKARLMALATERRAALRAETRSNVTARGVLGGLVPRPTWGRRLATGAMAAALSLAVGLAGVAQVGTAAASSLPGDSLYSMKRFGEDAQMLFAFDPDLKTTLRARFDARRLLEMRALLDNGRTVPEDLMREFLDQGAASVDEIARLSHDQRAMLAAALEADEDASRRLDPAVRDVLLPSVPEDIVPDMPAKLPIPLDWSPSSAPRPLPVEESPGPVVELDIEPVRSPISEAPTPGAPAEVSVPEPAPEPGNAPPPPPVVQREVDDEPSPEPSTASAPGPAVGGGEPAVGAPSPGEPTQPGAGGGDQPPPVVAPDPGGAEGPGSQPPPIVGPPPMEDPQLP